MIMIITTITNTVSTFQCARALSHVIPAVTGGECLSYASLVVEVQ